MLSKPSTFRRVGAAVSLIIPFVLFLIADVISPSWGDDTAEMVRDVAENPNAQAWSGVLYVIGFALLLPGILGIVHLIRGRGVTLAHLAAAFAVVGVGAFPALGVTGVVDAVAAETISPADHEALIDGFDDEAPAIVLLILILIPALLSLLLIAAAVWRSGLVPWWVAVVVIVGTVVLVLGNSQGLAIISDVLMLAAFGFIGLRMLQMGDEVWDRPPHDWRESTTRAA